MKICNSYVGIACDNCPGLQVGGDDTTPEIKCNDCIYFRGCEFCLMPRYGFCPEGKTDEEGGEKNE